MTEVNSKANWGVFVGLLGIVSLMIISLGYALRDSGTHYETENINQFVLEQQLTPPQSER